MRTSSTKNHRKCIGRRGKINLFNDVDDYEVGAFFQIVSLRPSTFAAVLEATNKKSLNLFKYLPTSSSVCPLLIKQTQARSARRQTVRAKLICVLLNPPDYIYRE